MTGLTLLPLAWHKDHLRVCAVRVLPLCVALEPLHPLRCGCPLLPACKRAT